MKEVCKLLSIVTLVLVMSLGMFLGLKANKRKDDARYEVIVAAFEDVNKAFAEQQKIIEDQNKLIEDYKRDCENITSKVINGEW